MPSSNANAIPNANANQNANATAIEITVQHSLDASSSGSLKEAFEIAVGELMSKLPDQDQGFELVGDDSDSADAGSSLGFPSQLPTPKSAYKPSTKDTSWLDRLTYASSCGAASAKLLKGESAEFPKEIRHAVKNFFFVVLRTKDGQIPPPGYYVFEGSGLQKIKPFLGDFQHDGKWKPGGMSVFKGWPSKMEVEAYLQGANFPCL